MMQKNFPDIAEQAAEVLQQCNHIIEEDMGANIAERKCLWKEHASSIVTILTANHKVTLSAAPRASSMLHTKQEDALTLNIQLSDGSMISDIPCEHNDFDPDKVQAEIHWLTAAITTPSATPVLLQNKEQSSTNPTTSPPTYTEVVPLQCAPAPELPNNPVPESTPDSLALAMAILLDDETSHQPTNHIPVTQPSCPPSNTTPLPKDALPADTSQCRCINQSWATVTHHATLKDAEHLTNTMYSGNFSMLATQVQPYLDKWSTNGFSWWEKVKAQQTLQLANELESKSPHLTPATPWAKLKELTSKQWHQRRVHLCQWCVAKNVLKSNRAAPTAEWYRKWQESPIHTIKAEKAHHMQSEWNKIWQIMCPEFHLWEAVHYCLHKMDLTCKIPPPPAIPTTQCKVIKETAERNLKEAGFSYLFMPENAESQAQWYAATKERLELVDNSDAHCNSTL